MLHSCLGAIGVFARAARVPSGNGEAYFRLGVLRSIEEMNTHFENLAIDEVEEAEAAARNTWIKPENEITSIWIHEDSLT